MDDNAFNRTYLIPANSKKATLIFSLFRPLDLLIFGIGVALTFLIAMIFPLTKLVFVILTLLPITIAGFLVFPVPNYHNVLVLIQEMIDFYGSRKKYIWRGWCYQYEQSDDESNKQSKYGSIQSKIKY